MLLMFLFKMLSSYLKSLRTIHPNHFSRNPAFNYHPGIGKTSKMVSPKASVFHFPLLFQIPKSILPYSYFSVVSLLFQSPELIKVEILSLCFPLLSLNLHILMPHHNPFSFSASKAPNATFYCFLSQL